MDEDDLSRHLGDIAGDVGNVDAIRLDVATRLRRHGRQRQGLAALAVAASVAVVSTIILLVGQRTGHPTPPAQQPAPAVGVVQGTVSRSTDVRSEMSTSPYRSSISPESSNTRAGTAAGYVPRSATPTAAPRTSPTTPRPVAPTAPVTSRRAQVTTAPATMTPPIPSGTTGSVPAPPATQTVPPTERPTPVTPASTAPPPAPPHSTAPTIAVTPTTPGG